VTAQTPDGKVVYQDSKVYMPVPHQLGRGDRMGRGPYDKSGILVDWALHPLEEKKEEYRIFVPAKDGKLENYEYIVEVELWYVPFGSKDEYSQLWRKTTQKITFSKKEPY
jgi:hypothetical protein